MLLATAALTMPLCAQSLSELEKELHSSSNTAAPTMPKPKTRIDWEDVFYPYDSSVAFGYTYSKYFPLSVQATYTVSFFSTGAEIGYNLDKKQYALNASNTINPQITLLYTLGGCFRHISANCGLGVILGNNTKKTFSQTDTGTFSYSSTKQKAFFTVRPSLTGHIPISDDEYYITVNVGYNFVPKCKMFNGPSFGIGFQFVLD